MGLLLIVGRPKRIQQWVFLLHSSLVPGRIMLSSFRRLARFIMTQVSDASLDASRTRPILDDDDEPPVIAVERYAER